MEKIKLVIISVHGQINYLVPKEGLTDIIVSAVDVINGDEIIRLEPGMKVE
jgi:hypothetical protein